MYMLYTHVFIKYSAFTCTYFDAELLGSVVHRYHLLFSLTGGGKYNFLGTKRWLEENMDHAGL